MAKNSSPRVKVGGNMDLERISIGGWGWHGIGIVRVLFMVRLIRLYEYYK